MIKGGESSSGGGGEEKRKKKVWLVLISVTLNLEYDILRSLIVVICIQ